MSSRSIAHSTLWQTGSQIVMAAFSIITIKLVTLGLSKELVGQYNSAYGYLQIFGMLADFGLYAVAVRELSKGPEEEKERTFGTLLVLRCCVLLLSLGAALLIAWSVPAWRNTHLPIGITIAAAVPLFTLLGGIMRTIFQVTFRLKDVFVAEVGQRIITVGLTAALIIMGMRSSSSVRDYEMILAFGGVGAAFLFLYSFIRGSRLLKIRPNWNRTQLKRMFYLAAPFGVAFLFTALYRQLDVTLIALLRTDFDLQNAYYGPVQRMMDMAYLLPTFLLNSTLPVVGALHEKGEDSSKLLGKTLLVILIIGSIGGLFAALWSRPIVELLTRESYLSVGDTPGSDTALRLLAAPIFFNGLILFSFYAMLAKNVWKPLVITLAAGAVLSLMLNLFLIPTYGFVGAAVSSIFTHAFLAVALLPQALRILPAKIPRNVILRWHAFGAIVAVMLAISGQFLGSSLVTALALIVALPLIAAVAWFTGLLSALREA
jgi:O-antigen/teichoic acid export membrane protein